MVRVIGGLLVVGGCCLCGVRAADELSKRVRLLEDLVQAVGVLERELALFRPALTDLLTRMAQGRSVAVAAFLEQCRAEVEKGMCFTSTWVEGVERLLLAKQEKRLLCGLGQVLGRYDDRGQAEAAGRIREELERCAAVARQDHRSRGRLYRTLGATAGGFLLLTLL